MACCTDQLTTKNTTLIITKSSNNSLDKRYRSEDVTQLQGYISDEEADQIKDSMLEDNTFDQMVSSSDDEKVEVDQQMTESTTETDSVSVQYDVVEDITSDSTLPNTYTTMKAIAENTNPMLEDNTFDQMVSTSDDEKVEVDQPMTESTTETNSVSVQYDVVEDITSDSTLPNTYTTMKAIAENTSPMDKITEVPTMILFSKNPISTTKKTTTSKDKNNDQTTNMIETTSEASVQDTTIASDDTHLMLIVSESPSLKPEETTHHKNNMITQKEDDNKLNQSSLGTTDAPYSTTNSNIIDQATEPHSIEWVTFPIKELESKPAFTDTSPTLPQTTPNTTISPSAGACPLPCRQPLFTWSSCPSTCSLYQGRDSCCIPACPVKCSRRSQKECGNGGVEECAWLPGCCPDKYDLLFGDAVSFGGRWG